MYQTEAKYKLKGIMQISLISFLRSLTTNDVFKFSNPISNLSSNNECCDSFLFIRLVELRTEKKEA